MNIDIDLSFTNIINNVMKDHFISANKTFKKMSTELDEKTIRFAFNCLVYDIKYSRALSIKDSTDIKSIIDSKGKTKINLFNVSKTGILSTLKGSCNFPDELVSKNLFLERVNRLLSRPDNNKPSIKIMLLALKEYAESTNNQTGAGGKKQTKERIVVNGKKRVVYVGKKGGKYIKQNGEFVSVAKYF